MSDKVHGLVKKLGHQAPVWDLDVPKDRAELERILRAELKPLLEASIPKLLNAIQQMRPFITNDKHIPWNNILHFSKLVAAKLQGWTARTPDGR